MSTPLHTVHSAAALERCLARAEAHSVLLLLDDAVYAAVAPHGRALLVLAEDLAARGLAETDLVPGARAVDMKEFVALTVTHSPVVGWF